jgi:hypothetical protein
MIDPKRWLDDASFASSIEHELLLSGKRLRPPEGAAARSWSELAPLLGPGPGPGSPGGSDPSAPSGSGLDGASGPLSLGSGASSLTAGTIKAFVVGAALGVGVMGVVQAARTPRPAPSVVLTPAAPTAELGKTPPGGVPVGERAELLEPGRPEPPSAAIAPVEPPPPALPRAPVVKSTAARVGTQTAVQGTAVTPASSASVEPSPAPPPLVESAPAAAASATPEGNGANAGPAPSGGGPRSANWLRAEAQDMARAKNLLGSGKAPEALVLLQNAADRFGGGALMQEREALIVEALFSSGRTEQGRARARAFVQKYPNSPMSARMRKLERGER